MFSTVKLSSLSCQRVSYDGKSFMNTVSSRCRVSLTLHIVSKLDYFFRAGPNVINVFTAVSDDFS